jgi:hypothetical protein
MFPTELFMTRHYGLALGFFTPLIMLMTELAAPAEPRTFITGRAIDNLLGVAVGITVALIIRAGPEIGRPVADRSSRPHPSMTAWSAGARCCLRSGSRDRARSPRPGTRC